MRNITLGTVSLNARAKKNIQLCIDRNEIGQGEFIKAFEDKVAEYVGVRNAIATCNGTTADAIMLAVLKYLFPYKTEVIVPALTFVAQINAVLMNGLKPVFIDIGRDLQIQDIERIEDDVLAIFPVHLLGRNCKAERFKDLGVPIIEDCCEGFGIKPLEMGSYSFFPSHTIATGEGGMIVTDNDKWAEIARKIRNHGRKSEDIMDKFHFDMVGFNGKMSNIVAAIGEATIDEADEIIKRRKENVELFNKIVNQEWYADSPHCYPIICKDQEERNRKLQELDNSGIEARKLFSSLPTQETIFRNGHTKGDFPMAEAVGERGLYVPCHQNLTDEELNIMIKVICPKVLF